jgi:hypothetical protein
MLDRDVSRARQEGQVVQVASALTQMTEAVTRLTRVTSRRRVDGVVQNDDEDGEDEIDNPEIPVTHMVAADPRF